MQKKLGLLLVIVLISISLLTGCDSNNDTGTSGDAPITIKVAHVLTEEHGSHITLEEVFKTKVEELSEGRLKVEIYPNAQLGGDRQTIEAVSLGTLEMVFPGAPVLSGFEEKFMVLDLPFLFETREAAYAALDGELGEKLNKLLEPHNLLNLGFAENGYRHITNNRGPITKPEDLNGLVIRTMENPVHTAAFRAFGANATPVSFGELFTALQQGTVDGQETPNSIIYTSRFYEVQDYLTLSGHFFTNAIYLINQDFYNDLSEDLQYVVNKAMEATIIAQREMVYNQNNEYLELLKAEGMNVNELSPEARGAFVKASESVYEQFQKELGPEFAELVELAKSYN